MMTGKVLVNGAGTVGSRAIRILSSLDIPVVAVKSTANINDIKTQELLQLSNQYKDNIEIYVTDGKDQEKRLDDFKNVGIEAKGSLSKLNWDEIDYIIDASPKRMEIQNFDNIYKSLQKSRKDENKPQINFMIQGGGEENLVYSCYLSAPNVKGAKLFEEMSKNDIKQVSCNTTFGGTALGLVLETEKPENIKDVYGTFIRRENDPGSKKKKEQELGPETKFKTHHGEDIQKVVEPLEEKIISTPALKCPWEHFHETVITIDFIEPYDFDAIEKTFEKYPRAVILRSNFDMGDIIEKINELNIPDADCLFPLYHLRQPTYTKKGPNGEERKTNKLEIVGLTPQRSIVAPSIADMVVKKALKPGATWEEAYDYVNNHAKWFAYKFGTLKKDLEYKMEPKI